MARATPTKATNELKEKLRREEDKVFVKFNLTFLLHFLLVIDKVY